MAKDEFPIPDEELHAFIDGELSADRAAEIARLCATSPALAQRIGAFQSDRNLLAAVYGPLIDRPIPRRMTAALGPAPARHTVPSGRREMRRWWLAAAACLIVLLAMPAISWLTPDALVGQAMAARQGSTVAGQRLPAAALASTEMADRLAAQSTALPVRVPDLHKAGYTLEALSTYAAGNGKQNLQISYRDRQDKVFTVFLRPSGGADRFDLHPRGHLEVCVWQNDDMGVVMIGEMSSKDMLRLASMTYADLNL